MNCRDDCGKEVADESAALAAGWTWLAVAGGWRCGPCVAHCLAVSKLVGTDGETVDALPKDSRGALPKDTSGTITPPTRIT